jgi:hypothetical protein
MNLSSSSASYSVREAGGVTSYTNNATGATSTLVDQSSAAGRGSGNYAAQYNANMAEQATGQFHGSGGPVTHLGTQNGVKYEARETASGTQVLRTDANGAQSVVTGVDANRTLMAFGYQASAGTTTPVTSNGKAFTITETTGGPIVRNDAGQQVYGNSASQVIQNSGYKVANTGTKTTNISSGAYAGYSITDVGEGPMVFDTNNQRVYGEQASKVIQDSGYVTYRHRGSEIAQAAGQRSGASMNAQPTMLSSGSSGGNSVGNSHTTVTNTVKGSWQQALSDRASAHTRQYDPVTNPEGYMGSVGGQKVYSDKATAGGYRPMVRDINANTEEVRYHDDGGSNNIATILLAKNAFNNTIRSNPETDPNDTGNGNNGSQM